MDMQAKLCLHTGAFNVTFDEVAAAPTPPRTRSHVPIPHVNFVELLRETMQRFGMRIQGEEHALAKQGNRYFGLFQTEDLLPGVATIIALRNAHDFAFRASAALGTKVFCCDNLALNGEVKLSRKHTTFIERDLPSLIMRAVERLIEHKGVMVDRVQRYQALPLLERDADHLLCTVIRGRGLVGSDAGKVLAEFAKPSHPEHLNENGERTLWTWYNSVTEVLKTTSIFALPKRSEVLQATCDAFAI